MLELGDIQGMLLASARFTCGRSSFLSFGQSDQGRGFLSRVVDRVMTAEPAAERPASCVYVAFTWNGLRALGINESALATFPESFRAGMPARAEQLGDGGASHPDHWEGGLASPDLHALLLVFAGDAAERARRIEEHQSVLATFPGVFGPFHARSCTGGS